MKFSQLSWRAKLALPVLMAASAAALLGLVELGVRLSGVETDLVPHKNVEIAIPAWLATDDNFSAGLQHGMKAADVVWLRHFTEARYTGTKLKPNIRVDAVNPYNKIELSKGTTFRFSSNSSGFRGREFGPKLPGVIRVVCIGDSTTFGWGVDDEYTYPRLLEARLNRPGGPKVEVFNLGIPGFTSRHGLAALRHYALPLDADVYVFSFGANDPRRQLTSADAALSAHDGWRGALRFAALRLKTYRLLRKVTFDLRDPARYQDVPESALVPAVSEADYSANLKTMIRTARGRGAKSVLLGVCAQESTVGLMKEVARAYDVPMVDALPLLVGRQDDLIAHRLYADEVQYYENLYGLEAMQRNKYLYISTDGCHPNRAGMSLLADALAETISRQ